DAAHDQRYHHADGDVELRTLAVLVAVLEFHGRIFSRSEWGVSRTLGLPLGTRCRAAGSPGDEPRLLGSTQRLVIGVGVDAGDGLGGDAVGVVSGDLEDGEADDVDVGARARAGRDRERDGLEVRDRLAVAVGA